MKMLKVKTEVSLERIRAMEGMPEDELVVRSKDLLYH